MVETMKELEDRLLSLANDAYVNGRNAGSIAQRDLDLKRIHDFIIPDVINNCIEAINKHKDPICLSSEDRSYKQGFNDGKIEAIQALVKYRDSND